MFHFRVGPNLAPFPAAAISSIPSSLVHGQSQGRELLVEPTGLMRRTASTQVRVFRKITERRDRLRDSVE